MPRLPASRIPRTTGPYRVQSPTGDDVRLTCPDPGCAWTATRPPHGAWSAQEAHRIAHAKGMA